MISNIKINNLSIIFGLILTLVFSCGSKNDDLDIPFVEPEVIEPSKLSLTISITGKDPNNPNGDGTGVINCIASAEDAVKYEFRFGTGEEIESSNGNVNFTYTNEGTNIYTVYVYAYSSTGHLINTSETITIFVKPHSYDILVFSDEFDVNGSPDATKWGYDTGDGGWGNNEVQHYTDRIDNAVVEDGVLKIIAKTESYNGSDYTSARMKTQDLFDFTYGRVDVRAKLPAGGGTWPAIWMLGSNFSTVGWPACGEIDIMEHVGNDPGHIGAALHTLSSSGATINQMNFEISDATSEFHVYSLNWSPDQITFLVDDEIFYTYNPANKDANTWPYDANQFLILNIALGGTLGGTIDTSFIEDSMEIDYVRVYQ